MFVFLAQKAHFGGSDVVGQSYHGTQIVGGHQMVGDDYGTGNALEETLGCV